MPQFPCGRIRTEIQHPPFFYSSGRAWTPVCIFAPGFTLLVSEEEKMADAEGHDFPQTSCNIRRSMQQNLQIFDSIRGKEVNIPFWDIVVITALDEGQRNAYDLQLKSKLARGELPLGVKYHVFYDPPGPKIGNGGSVLVTIGDLLKIYEEKELMNSKIIMLPAGGYSQRLPNASVLGKAFTALPIGKFKKFEKY